jgi:hypothetical protein
VSAGAWDAFDLVAALLFAAGAFYYFVAGVHYEDRALSRAAALAFLVCAGVAAWMVVRILR